MMPLTSRPSRSSRVITLSVVIAATLSASACVPLAATGIALGAIAVIDRRTIGAQTEDQAIELKSISELRRFITNTSGIAITSFNRRVLLTGQVASSADKQNAGAVIAGLANVRGVYNELAVSDQGSFAATASDTTLTTKVKTVLLRDADVPGNSIKVKTEQGVVYLMGLVTNTEAQQAAELTSRVAGVSRVITVFEILSATDAARLNSWSRPTQPVLTPAAAPAYTPAPAVTPTAGQAQPGIQQQAPAVGVQPSATPAPSVTIQPVTPNSSTTTTTTSPSIAPNQALPQPVQTPLVTPQQKTQ